MVHQLTIAGAYTVPAISFSDPKDWFIYFRFTHQDKDYLRKYRGGINRIKDKVQRTAQAEQLRQEREDWLKMGWNPITDPEFKLLFIAHKQGKAQMNFCEALDFALSKKSLKRRSIQDYTNMLDFMKEVAVITGHSLLEVGQMDRPTALDLIDECARKRKFSNHNYNKYVSCLRSMFSELLNRRVIAVNPLLDFKDKIVPESNKYTAYTAEDKVRITEHLAKVHPPLFVVMSIVYHTGIRPQEALELLVRDIDMTEGIITIAQEAGNLEKSKTTSIRKVPINPHLYELLDAMKLTSYPGHYFVFGRPTKKGGGSQSLEKGKRAFGAMRTDYFVPSPYHVKRDTVSKLWKKLIMDPPPTGLGIKKHLYAAKHTGTDDKTEAGMELKEIQHLYGHSSEAMTARYNKTKRELEAKKEILAKSPAFSKP